MRYYVLVHKDNVTNKMLEDSGFDSPKAITVVREDETETDYCIVPINDRAANNFVGYRKYDSTNLTTELTKIKEDRFIQGKNVAENASSAWKDSHGYVRRFQPLGIIQSAIEDEVTWLADTNYVWGGMRYHISGAEVGDSICLQAINSLTQEVLDTSVDWYIYDGNFSESAFEYFTEIPLGVQIKLTLKKGVGNTGIVTGIFNMKLYAKG